MNNPSYMAQPKMQQKNYRVWECKIIVPIGTKFPSGFDAPPRSAACMAVEKVTDIVGCFSGWGGSLDEIEVDILEGRPL